MKDSKIKYEKRLVAFIDILGFKEIVKQSEKDISKIELIYSVLDYLKIGKFQKNGIYDWLK